MSYPRITVVTPSFNQAQFLEDSILSVLNQDYPNLEYFVLDGGSEDQSKEIIRRHASRIDYWRSRRDEGQAAALVEGFAMATGDILAWLNSDDLLAPGALSAVAESWLAHGPDLVIAGHCQLITKDGSTLILKPSFQTSYNSPEPLPTNRMLDLMHHWFPGEFFMQPEVFFPRAAYEEVGGIDPSIYYTMDYDLYLKLALIGTPIVVIPKVLAHFRAHSHQKTADESAVRRQAVAMANTYLTDPRVRMGWAGRRKMAVTNRLTLLRVRRRIASLGRLAMRA